MSISTASMSRCLLRSCSPDTLREAQFDGWAKELTDRVRIWDHDFDSFLSTFVPSSAPPDVPLSAGYDAAFASYTPSRGKELQSYDGLFEGLETVVSSFPSDKKPSFYANHKKQLLFPFSSFKHNHHTIFPDIAVSVPGRNLEDASWRDTAIFIEAKGGEDQDPYDKAGMCHCEVLAQMAVDARGLVVAHGLLAAYVIGVFGHNVRIVRYDHSGVVASPPFSISQEPAKLAQFFWKFAHPHQAVSFVGCDPTTRRLEAFELTWIQKRLRRAKKDALTDPLLCRRTEVYDTRNGTKQSKAYFLLQLIDINARLLSRSTAVWLSMPDPRTLMADGTLSKFPPLSDDPIEDMAIVKESWRQIVRQSELSFYDRLQKAIPQKDWYGLPRLLFGCDLGEEEVEEWRTRTEGKTETYQGKGKGKDLSSLHEFQASAMPLESPANTVVPADRASSSTFPFNSVPADPRTPSRSHNLHFSSPLTPLSSEVDVEESHERDTSPRPSSSTSSLPYPQHQTFTWRATTDGDEGDVAHERSHMRLVIGTVGRRLTHFRSTREGVTAIRDAIKGHQFAWEKAKVLHRDVSAGNILIVENTGAELWVGFLHDFDYSAMDELQVETEVSGDSEPGESASVSGPPADPARTKDAEAVLKERTGTHYFLARDLLLYPGIIHTVAHDLESFFWVLIWIVLRHTAHKHPAGDNAYSETFKAGDRESAMAKLSFIHDAAWSVPGNTPLSFLIKTLKALVKKHYQDEDPVHLTHEAVLKVFDEALAMKGWPEDDKAIHPVKLIDDRTKTVYTQKKKRKGEDGTSGKTASSKRSKTTGTASGSKSAGSVSRNTGSKTSNSGSARNISASGSSHTSSLRPQRNTPASNGSRGGKLLERRDS